MVLDHYEVKSEDSTFYLNVCGPSNVACGKDSESELNAVCQKPGEIFYLFSCQF